MQKLTKILFTTACLLSISSSLIAQSLTKTAFYGNIIDSITKKGIGYAAIQINKLDSGQLAFVAISDSVGSYRIEQIKPGKYQIIVTSLGYSEKSYSIRIPRQRYYRKIIELNPTSQQLEEIKITASQKGAVQKIDQIIFRPDSLDIAKSRTGNDLLRRIPGVSVKRTDNTVSYQGMSNVLVLVNGSLGNRNIGAIAPEEIKKVEIIENPSLQYGHNYATAINIILKEQQQGLRIRSNLEYYTKNIKNFSYLHIDYKKEKFRVFGELRLKNFYNENDTDSIIRKTTYDTISIEQYKYTNRNKTNKYRRVGNSIQYGADFIPNKNRLINLTGNFEQYNYNSTRNLLNSYGSSIDASYFGKEKNEYEQKNTLQNYTVFFREKFSKEKHLTINTNFYLMRKNHTRLQEAKYSFDNGLSSKYINLYETKYAINSINSRLHYEQSIFTNIKLQSGLIFYNRQIDNQYFRESGNRFLKYNDYRSSSYLASSLKKDKLSAKAGIRAEVFTYKTDNQNTKTVWHFLPNAAVLIKGSKNQSIRYSLNSSLKYPKYQMLAPFQFYSNDSTSVSQGSPDITPETNFRNEIKYSFKKKKNYFSISGYYNYKKNVIGKEISINNENILTEQMKNVGNSHKIGGKLFLQVKLLNFLMQGFYIESYYQKYIRNRSDGFAYRMMLNTEVPLPFDGFLSAYFIYNGKLLNYSGYSYSSPIIDEITVGKSFLNDYAEISITLVNFFLDEYAKEKQITPIFKETYHSYYNNKAILFRLNFFFTKGKKIPKDERELLMEKDIK